MRAKTNNSECSKAHVKLKCSLKDSSMIKILNIQYLLLFFLTAAAVAKVIESSALSISQQQKSSSTAPVASISVQSLATMTTLSATTTGASSSNSNLPQTAPTTVSKKSRPKTSSPTRHGPQQCQV